MQFINPWCLAMIMAIHQAVALFILALITYYWKFSKGDNCVAAERHSCFLRGAILVTLGNILSNQLKGERLQSASLRNTHTRSGAGSGTDCVAHQGLLCKQPSVEVLRESQR